MTIIYTGKPIPLDGQRKLNGKEAAQRAKAMKCVRSKSTECQGQVFVGLFFDGTGNNDRWVEESQTQTQRVRNKHSNVARLFDAHVIEPENGIFAYYMPGVGTPFEEIGDTSKLVYDNAGMGFGYMGADRINYGITSVLNAVHLYLTGTRLFGPGAQRTLVNTMSQDVVGPLSIEGGMRWTTLTAVEEKLAGVVKGHQRKVLQINVSIFGFSRGAAQARACAFWLSQICERNGGGMTLAGIPLRIGFMGIFDTVAAVGVGDITPFTEGHMAWAEDTQSIHPAVEDCAHFIALHEQRASFPLEAAVGRGNVGYPGMHSDVGGGYWPGEQGKAMPEWGDSPHLSQIPLIDMHFAAIKAGVPMMTIEEIKADPGVAKSFATDTRLLKAYNTWLANQGVKAGDIRAFTEAHTRHYIRWRASLHTSGKGGGIPALEFFNRATLTVDKTKDQTDLREADEAFALQLRWLLERRQANATFGGYLKERLKDTFRMTSPILGTLLIEPGKAPLTAYEKKFIEIAVDGPMPPAGCAELFADYVHDSRAGFRPLLKKHEFTWLTGGYLRFRHVFKEEIHGESRVYGWANEGLSGLKAAGNAVVDISCELWDATVAAYARARRHAVAAGRAAVKATSDAYQAAEREVIATGKAAAKATTEAYESTEKQVTATGRAAMQAASTAYQSAENAVARRYNDAETALYRELTARYASAKGAILDYYSPEAIRKREKEAQEASALRRQRLEAEEYARTRPRW